jgi:hypothetical protein
MMEIVVLIALVTFAGVPWLMVLRLHWREWRRR